MMIGQFMHDYFRARIEATTPATPSCQQHIVPQMSAHFEYFIAADGLGAADAQMGGMQAASVISAKASRR